MVTDLYLLSEEKGLSANWQIGHTATAQVSTTIGKWAPAIIYSIQRYFFGVCRRFRQVRPLILSNLKIFADLDEIFC